MALLKIAIGMIFLALILCLLGVAVAAHSAFISVMNPMLRWIGLREHRPVSLSTLFN